MTLQVLQDPANWKLYIDGVDYLPDLEQSSLRMQDSEGSQADTFSFELTDGVRENYATTVKYTDYNSVLAWETNPSKATDGNDSTYARTTINGDLHVCNDNDAPGSGSEIVAVKVRLRVGCNASKLGNEIEIVPYKTLLFDNTFTYKVMSPDLHWTPEFDITDDPNAPAWTWSDISGLDLRLTASTGDADSVDVYLAAVEVRVYSKAFSFSPITVVEWEADGTNIFGGQIDTVRTEASASGGFNRYKIACTSWPGVLKKVETGERNYVNQTAGAIFADLVATYLDGTWDTSNVDAGPTLETFAVRIESISKAFDNLRAVTGYDWLVNADKEFWFKDGGIGTAPFAVSDALRANYDTAANEPVFPYESGSFSQEESSDVLYNKVIVDIGDKASDWQIETMSGDGSTYVFALDHKPIEDMEHIKVDGTALRFGTIGYDNFPTVEVLMDVENGTLHWPDGSGPASGTDNIEVKYRYKERIKVEDTSAAGYSLAGNVWLTKHIRDHSISNATQAADVAAEFLAENGGAFTERYRFKVRRLGLLAGQTVRIYKPVGLMYDAVDAQIRSVTYEYSRSAKAVICTVQAGGRDKKLSSAVGSGSSSSATYASPTQPYKEGIIGTMRVRGDLVIERGHIEMGAASAYMVGDGAFLGRDPADDLYKLHFGDPSGDHMRYDGSDLVVTGKFIGGSDISYTDAQTWTINQDANTATSALVLRTSAADATLTWDGSDLESDVPLIIDVTDSEALLVRKASDAGDVFAVNTTSPGLTATADLDITSPRGASGYMRFNQYDGDDDSFEVKVNPGEFGTTTKLSMNPEEGMILTASYWSVQATTASITAPTLHAIGKLTVGDDVAAAGYLHIEGSSTDNFIYIKNAQDRPAWLRNDDSIAGNPWIWDTNDQWAWYVDGSVALSIDSVGNTALKKATASYTLDVDGTFGVSGVSSMGDDVRPVTSYDASLGMETLKWLQIYGAELVVDTLVAQDVRSTIGGRVLVIETDELTQDADAADTTIYTKRSSFAVDDRLHLEARGNVEFMAILTGPFSAGPGMGYYYFVNRNLDGTGANDWLAGDAVVNTGSTGDGWIDLYAISSMNGLESGPSIVGNVRRSSTYNDWQPRWAVGNLDGLYGKTGTVWGAAFGDEDAVHIVIDDVSGIQINYSTDTVGLWDTDGSITLYSLSTPRVHLDSDGSGYLASSSGIVWDTSGDVTMSGSIVLSAAADPSTSGLYIGNDKLGYYSATNGWMTYMDNFGDFYLAGASDNYFSWDASTEILTAAGWTLAADAISVNDGQGNIVELNSGGYLEFQDKDNAAYRLHIGVDDGSWLMYYGTTPSGSKFKLDKYGNLTVNHLTASTDGEIGGFDIGATTLTNGDLVLDAGNKRIHFGSTYLYWVDGGVGFSGGIGVADFCSVYELNSSVAVNVGSTAGSRIQLWPSLADIDAPTRLRQTLQLDGNLTIGSSALTVAASTGNTVIAGTLDIQGNISNSSGTVTVADNFMVSASGFTNLNGTKVAGGLTVTGNITNDSGDVTVADNLDVSGQLDVDSIITATGTIDAGAGFKDNGVAGVDGTFDSSNTVTVSGGIITAIS